MQVPFEIKKAALKKALGIGAASGAAFAAAGLLDPEEGEAATFSDMRKVVQQVNRDIASSTLDKGSRAAKHFGRFASQELSNLKDIPQETIEGLDIKHVTHLRQPGWQGMIEGGKSPDFRPQISIPSYVNKGVSQSAPGMIDVEPNYRPASSIAHEVGHGWQYKHGIYGVNREGLLKWDDPITMANEMPKLVIPEILNSRTIPPKVKNEVVNIFHNLFGQEKDVSIAIQELSHGMHTHLHSPGELLAAVYDATVTKKMGDIPTANKYFGKLGKYMLAVPSVAALAVGIDTALQETGQGSTADAAMRVHISPTKISKLTSLKDAPLGQGTGGMSEGAGLYTTELKNTKVQESYAELFKRDTATFGGWKSPSIQSYKNAIDNVAVLGERGQSAINQGMSRSIQHSQTLLSADETLDKATGRIRSEADKFGDWKRRLQDVIDDRSKDTRELLRDIRRWDSHSPEFDHAYVSGMNDKVLTNVGEIIGYKAIQKHGLVYKPGQPGYAYKHTLKTWEDLDFLEWNSPVSDKIRPKIKRFFKDRPEAAPEWSAQTEEKVDAYLNRVSGHELYFNIAERLSANKKIMYPETEASTLLHNAGISGMRYPVNRKNGPGFNEVLYGPHKDAVITSIVKLGIPLVLATVAVQSAYEGEAEAMPKPLWDAAKKSAIKVQSGALGKGGQSRVMGEAWQFTFPAGPYKGETVKEVVKSKTAKTFYLAFESGNVGRLDKEEAKLLAENIGIGRYLDIWDTRSSSDKLFHAKKIAGTKATRNKALADKAWMEDLTAGRGTTTGIPPAAEATPIETLEKVHKMGLNIKPYKQVEYRGQKFDIPVQYANLLLAENIVTTPGLLLTEAPKLSGAARAARAKGMKPVGMASTPDLDVLDKFSINQFGREYKELNVVAQENIRRQVAKSTGKKIKLSAEEKLENKISELESRIERLNNEDNPPDDLIRSLEKQIVDLEKQLK